MNIGETIFPSRTYLVYTRRLTVCRRGNGTGWSWTAAVSEPDLQGDCPDHTQTYCYAPEHLQMHTAHNTLIYILTLANTTHGAPITARHIVHHCTLPFVDILSDQPTPSHSTCKIHIALHWNPSQQQTEWERAMSITHCTYYCTQHSAQTIAHSTLHIPLYNALQCDEEERGGDVPGAAAAALWVQATQWASAQSLIL